MESADPCPASSGEDHRWESTITAHVITDTAFCFALRSGISVMVFICMAILRPVKAGTLRWYCAGVSMTKLQSRQEANDVAIALCALQSRSPEMALFVQRRVERVREGAFQTKSLLPPTYAVSKTDIPVRVALHPIFPPQQEGQVPSRHGHAGSCGEENCALMCTHATRTAVSQST